MKVEIYTGSDHMIIRQYNPSVIQAALDRIILNNEDPQEVLDEAAEQLNLTIDSIPADELIK